MNRVHAQVYSGNDREKWAGKPRAGNEEVFAALLTWLDGALSEKEVDRVTLAFLAQFVVVGVVGVTINGSRQRPSLFSAFNHEISCDTSGVSYFFVPYFQKMASFNSFINSERIQ